MVDNEEEGLRRHDAVVVSIPAERQTDCIDIIKQELASNQEWAMELRRRVFFQALTWPFIVLGAAIASEALNLGGMESVLVSDYGAAACVVLVTVFILLGIFFGFMERRVWERAQYLRRLLLCVMSEGSGSAIANFINVGCLTERDFKAFDMRGAYFIQYILISLVAGSALVLIGFLVSPR